MKYDFKNPAKKTLRFWLNCIAAQLFVEPKDMTKWVKKKEKSLSMVLTTTEMTVIEENKKEVNIDAEIVLDYSFLYYTEHLENYEENIYSSTFVLFRNLKALEEYKTGCISDTGAFEEFVLHSGELLPYKEGTQFEDGSKIYHTNVDRGINDYYPPEDTSPFVEFDLYEVDKGNGVYDYENSLAVIELRLNEEIGDLASKEDRKIRAGNVIEQLKNMSNYKIRRSTEYIDFKIGLFSKDKEIQIYKGEVIKDDGFEIVDSLGVEIMERHSR